MTIFYDVTKTTDGKKSRLMGSENQEFAEGYAEGAARFDTGSTFAVVPAMETIPGSDWDEVPAGTALTPEQAARRFLDMGWQEQVNVMAGHHFTCQVPCVDESRFEPRGIAMEPLNPGQIVEAHVDAVAKALCVDFYADMTGDPVDNADALWADTEGSERAGFIKDAQVAMMAFFPLLEKALFTDAADRMENLYGGPTTPQQFLVSLRTRANGPELRELGKKFDVKALAQLMKDATANPPNDAAAAGLVEKQLQGLYGFTGTTEEFKAFLHEKTMKTPIVISGNVHMVTGTKEEIAASLQHVLKDLKARDY